MLGESLDAQVAVLRRCRLVGCDRKASDKSRAWWAVLVSAPAEGELVVVGTLGQHSQRDRVVGGVRHHDEDGRFQESHPLVEVEL